MNFSVEAEGIDFILRFRDEASGKLNMAEKGYTKLVSAMQNLITTQRAFSDSILETLNTASTALKNNPFPIATPITISPDQVSMMAQFEAQAVAWFRNMSNQMLTYINRVRRAMVVTQGLRDTIQGILKDLKDFGKWMGENSEQVSNLAEKFDGLQKNAQKTNFHIKDTTSSLKDNARQSEDTQKKLGGLLGIFDQLGKAKYALSGAVGGLLLGQSVQKYASVEDAAYAVKQSIGETAGSVGDLVTRFRELSRDSGYSAQSVAGAFALIAQKSGHITYSTNQLALLSVEFSKLTGTSAELAGELSGELVGAFNLSEQAAGEFLKMANLARKGSRGLTGPEFIQAMTQNVDEIKKLSMTMGMQSDEFLKRNASSMMALQKEFSMIYGDVAQVQSAMKGAVSIVGDDAQKIRILLAGSGHQYEEFRDKIKQGKLDDAFIDLADAWQKRINQIPEQQRGVYRRMFAEAQGFQEDQLAELERLDVARIRKTRGELDDARKVNAEWNKGVEEWKATFAGILEQLNSIWSYFQTVTAPFMKWLLWGIEQVVKVLRFGSQHIWGFSTLVGGLVTAGEVVIALQGVVSLLKLFGAGGVFRQVIGLFMKLPAVGAMLEASAARIVSLVSPLIGSVLPLIARLSGLVGAAMAGAHIGTWLKQRDEWNNDFMKNYAPKMTFQQRHDVWEKVMSDPNTVYHPDEPVDETKVTPQSHTSIPLPSMVSPISYQPDNSGDAADQLQRIAETGDNTQVVAELRRIAGMLNVAMSRMSSGREPLVARYGAIARGEA